jgi:acetylglutamate kinase
MVTHRTDPSATVRALKGAAPYVRLYKGKIFVVKAGGAVFADTGGTRMLIEQIAILHHLGIRVVLVHGGGPQLDDMQRSLGIEPRMVKGRRVTDARSIDVTTMVLNGLINTRILAMCRELGIDAIGVSGVDAGLIRARRRPPVEVDGETVDYGFVGDVAGVDATLLLKQLDAGLMPVVSPLSSDETGCVLNINADTVAAQIGAALGAEKLILCTGMPGILEDVSDPGSLVSYTDIGGLAKLEAAGSFAAGMLPKATAIEGAIRGGVRRVHVISYKVADSLLAEVFTNEGTGTLIVEDIDALTPAEQSPQAGS